MDYSYKKTSTLKKSSEHMKKTRETYVKAIGVLGEENVREMCMRYADMETKLGEVYKARAIYFHCSQFSGPRMTNKFWQTWKDFETQALTSSEDNEPISITDSLNAAATKFGEQQKIMPSAHTINFVREATVGGASAEPKVVNFL
ncbi:hypothetical protein TKK_0018456 [Trichogramma kaykai]